MTATPTIITVELAALQSQVRRTRAFDVSLPADTPLMPHQARDAFIEWAAEMFAHHLRDLLTEAADWPHTGE